MKQQTKLPRVRNHSKSEQPHFISFRPDTNSQPIVGQNKSETVKQIKKAGIVEQVKKFLISETVTPEVHLKNITFEPQTEKKEPSRQKNYFAIELGRSAS